MFFNSFLTKKVRLVIENLAQENKKIAIAESCTGGLLSALFTEISGSSKVFERGFVVYSNEAKIELIKVRVQTLEKFGAVSSEVVREMAVGAIKNSQSHISLAITGIAGPDGGGDEKKVGLVYIAVAKKSDHDIKVSVRKFNFSGNRDQVRYSSVVAALDLLENFV